MDKYKVSHALEVNQIRLVLGIHGQLARCIRSPSCAFWICHLQLPMPRDLTILLSGAATSHSIEQKSDGVVTSTLCWPRLGLKCLMLPASNASAPPLLANVEKW
jgi:hypothetical protein